MSAHVKKVEIARARVLALLREIAELEAMGPSRAELRSRLAADLTEKEARGHHALGRRVMDPGERAHAGGLLAPVSGDMLPVLLALLGTDAVLAALDRHVAAQPEGLDASTRAARLAELRAALFDAELAEEAAIVAAEAEGLDVQRRADADPAAVLHVAG